MAREKGGEEGRKGRRADGDASRAALARAQLTTHGCDAEVLATIRERVSPRVYARMSTRGEELDACGKGIARLSHARDVHVGTLLNGGSKSLRSGDLVDDDAEVDAVILGQLPHDVDHKVDTGTTPELLDGVGGVGGIGGNTVAAELWLDI